MGDELTTAGTGVCTALIAAAFLVPKTVSAATAEADIVAQLASCAARLEAGRSYESYVDGFADARDAVSGALAFMRSRVETSEAEENAETLKKEFSADLVNSPMQARSRVSALVDECLAQTAAVEAIFNGVETSRVNELEAATNAQREATERAESEAERAEQAERRAIAAEAAAERAKAEIAILKEQQRERQEAKAPTTERSDPREENENSVSLNVRENVQRALQANGYTIFESAEEMECMWTGSAHQCRRPTGGTMISVMSSPYRVRILNAGSSIDCLRFREGELVAQGNGDDCR
ncbi:hypothetical protein FA04_30795 (plasmid) [Ensifer adhaerens]|jgi:hypothetical protein|nr:MULTISPECIES: hypothetical protein [Ensifer]OWZ89578.1 hypothetical protein B9J07_32010 [Sinorhizobium sp. LM21]SFH36265.1 hypothetical protein SAMN05216459_12757 [Ensifer sp. OV372]ANK77068.1 hypothetical protein FA04_30795 [Ensifer adhaerens]KDP73145.1 hypothetical protein FA04_13815 [Ensifer adhaerens]MBD9525084.1 hypothetical protein [Ensifer sp. ENS02]